MSAITLTKGSPVSLTKDGASVPLTNVHIGAGWDIARGAGSYDLDLIVLMLKDSKTKEIITQSNGARGVIYFGAKSSACGSIVLDKDNRTGEGEGYDENIQVNLETLAAGAECLAVCINIYQGVEKGQTFGQVENAFIDVNVPGLDTIKADLTEDYSSANLVHVADIYKHNGEWRVKKIGLGLDTGLAGLMAEYGVPTTA